MVLFVFFFFFQAEDGIRDADVTGVQTCALPIFPSFILYHLILVCRLRLTTLRPGTVRILRNARSEERRVGKECRSWWSAYHSKKKHQADTGHRQIDREGDSGVQARLAGRHGE